MIINSTKLKRLMYFLMFYMSFLRFFTVNFGVLYQLTNLAIVFFIAVTVWGLYFSKNKMTSKIVPLSMVRVIMIISIIVALIAYLYYGYSLMEFLNGVYYHLRLPVFLILCSIFFDVRSVEKLNDFIVKVVYIDAAFMTYQFLFMGLRQDFIGGIFGNTQGCNGIQNVFCIIGLVILVAQYLYKKSTIKALVLYIAVTCYMAAIAELTIYFVEVAIIFLISFLVVKQKGLSMRKVLVAAVGVLGIAVGFWLLVKYFPTKVRFLNPEEILLYLGKDNSGVYTISRIHGISQVSNVLMNDNIQRIIGFGMGRTLEGTQFYAQNGRLNYVWFSSALTMMEMGYIGVLSKLLIFIAIGAESLISIRRTNISEKYMYLICFIMSILCGLLFFYNNTLDDKYCIYLIAYTLSISNIVGKTEGKGID